MTSVFLIVVCSVFIISVTDIFYEDGSIASNSLEWADIGNSTIIYDFTILARFGAEDAYQYWFPLNNSQVRVTIDRLPPLNSSMSAEWFIENVANSDKVQVSRLDRSEIKFSLRTILERAVSFLIFPIGDWEYFDDYFGDDFRLVNKNEQYPTHYEFMGRSSSLTTYTFTRNWLQQESGTGTYKSFTNGEIEKNSGIPVYISHHWLFSHVNGFEYTVILSQHSTDSTKS